MAKFKKFKIMLYYTIFLNFKYILDWRLGGTINAGGRTI